MPLRIEVIDRAYAAVLAAKTPAERAAMIQDCHTSARVFLAAGERLRHPERSEAEVARAVAERLRHGAD